MISNSRVEELKHRFQHHPPANPQIAKRFEFVRGSLLDVTVEIGKRVPTTECREFSIFCTKMEEAMFWANAAIAREQDRVKFEE